MLYPPPDSLNNLISPGSWLTFTRDSSCVPQRHAYYLAGGTQYPGTVPGRHHPTARRGNGRFRPVGIRLGSESSFARTQASCVALLGGKEEEDLDEAG